MPEKIINLKDKASLKEIVASMKRKESFIITTDDPNFKPLGYDKYSAEKWIGAAGGGLLMTIGAGALVLAFIDPEPTSKLSLMVGGGIITVLAGGGVIITLLVVRSGYTSVMRFNKSTGQYEWVLEPK